MQSETVRSSVILAREFKMALGGQLKGLIRTQYPIPVIWQRSSDLTRSEFPSIRRVASWRRWQSVGISS